MFYIDHSGLSFVLSFNIVSLPEYCSPLLFKFARDLLCRLCGVLTFPCRINVLTEYARVLYYNFTFVRRYPFSCWKDSSDDATSELSPFFTADTYMCSEYLDENRFSSLFRITWELEHDYREYSHLRGNL